MKAELGAERCDWKSSCSATGYVIFYTDDPNLPDQSWVVHGVKGDHLNNTITDLRPNAKYFFKLQAKNKAGFGPPTNPISHVLPDGEGIWSIH